jgi:hypothetical protein
LSREKAWFSLVVAEAALITTAGYIVSALLVFRIGATSFEQAALGAAVVLLPTALAAWWIFRKLQARLSRREARAVTIAFVLCAPIVLLVAVVLAELTGGHAEKLLGSPFALAGAISGVFVVAPLGSIVPTALTLWMTRRIMRLEATDVQELASH